MSDRGGISGAEWLAQVIAAADTDPWRAAVRQAAAAGNRPALVRLAREVDVRSQPATALSRLGKILADRKGFDAAADILRRAQRQYRVRLAG